MLYLSAGCSLSQSYPQQSTRVLGSGWFFLERRKRTTSLKITLFEHKQMGEAKFWDGS